MDISWTPTAKRALVRLPEKGAAAVVEFVYGAQAADNPRRVGTPLRFELEGPHSARRGDFGFIYRIRGQVTMIAIEHRADAYRPHQVEAGRGPSAPI